MFDVHQFLFRSDWTLAARGGADPGGDSPERSHGLSRGDLAGLGVIGKNNLLVTPEFGTRVRLRGIFMEAELEATGPIDFDPCHGWDRPCRQSCPRGVFRSGAFERALCKKENDQREADREILAGSIMGIEEARKVSKPCRYCEFACPVAQGGSC